jgi:hypothetical protein
MSHACNHTVQTILCALITGLRSNLQFFVHVQTILSVGGASIISLLHAKLPSLSDKIVVVPPDILITSCLTALIYSSI